MQAEKFREKLLVVTFLAFGQTTERNEFFFDCTIEQGCNLVWKICPTAIILYAWEYGLTEPIQHSIMKKKLSDEELSKFNKNF